jgi:hypothetical protein
VQTAYLTLPPTRSTGQLMPKAWPTTHHTTFEMGRQLSPPLRDSPVASQVRIKSLLGAPAMHCHMRLLQSRRPAVAVP